MSNGWTGSLAGSDLDAESGEIIFSNDIWKSRGRREPGVSVRIGSVVPARPSGDVGRCGELRRGAYPRFARTWPSSPRLSLRRLGAKRPFMSFCVEPSDQSTPRPPRPLRAPELSGEVYVVHRAEVRPVLVLSAGGSEISRHLKRDSALSDCAHSIGRTILWCRTVRHSGRFYS